MNVEGKSEKREYSKAEVLQRLTTLCARGEHCQHDITEKMRRWNVSEKIQAEVMEYLVAERFVDDARYARFFINDKLKYNKWGKRKVEQALRLKRIPTDVFRDILDEAGDNEEYSDTLRSLLRTKMKSVKGRNAYDIRCKLIRFALSRGFDMGSINRALDDIDIPDDSDSVWEDW